MRLIGYTLSKKLYTFSEKVHAHGRKGTLLAPTPAMRHNRRTYKKQGHRDGKPDHDLSSAKNLWIEPQPLEQAEKSWQDTSTYKPHWPQLDL